MTKWEYKRVQFNVYCDSEFNLAEYAMTEINRLGEEGWELVNVVQLEQHYHTRVNEYYFKRIKISN